MENLCGLLCQSCIYMQWSAFKPDCLCYCCINEKKEKENAENAEKQEVTIIHWNETIPFTPPITQGQVIKVYDGDTITIAAKLPYDASPLYRFSVRLLGIDTPEIKGKTAEEKEAAHAAQKALEYLILHKIVYLKDNAQEKYGRILANVYIDSPENPINQIHVNKWMLDNGYAYEYDGKTKKQFTSDVISSEVINRL